MVFVLFALLIGLTAFGESQGNPLVNSIFGEPQPNLEGKK